NYSVSGTVGTVTGFGPDSGHTAFRFNKYGNTDSLGAIAGDFLITVDYSNGGTVPLAHIFVWCDPQHLGTNPSAVYTMDTFNIKTTKQFIFTKVFNDYSKVYAVNNDGDPTAKPFGWAEIAPIDTTEPFIFGRANAIPTDGSGSSNTLGPPWGNLSTLTPVTSD